MVNHICRNRWLLCCSDELCCSRYWMTLSLIHCLATGTAEPHISWCSVLACQTHSWRRIENETVRGSVNTLSIKQILSLFTFLEEDTLTVDYLIITTNTLDTETNRISFHTVCWFLDTISLDNHLITSTVSTLRSTLTFKVLRKSLNALSTVRFD